MSAPGPLPDHAKGAACVPGVPAVVHPLVTRVTAPNPSVMTGPGTNTYVVGDESVVVFDPGPQLTAHLELVTEVVAGREVTAVAVTHHHVDHAQGARALASSVGAPVVGFGHEQFEVDVAATEGSTLLAGGVELVAWHTPGHASDHLCFFAAPLGWLFSGDHLMQGSTVVIRPPDGDLTAYLSSLARVRDDPRVTSLAPGHGRVMDEPSSAAADVLAHRERRGEIVLDALRTHGHAAGAALRVIAYADVGPERDAVATATCWAHLLALVDDGRATSSSPRIDPDAEFAAT